MSIVEILKAPNKILTTKSLKAIADKATLELAETLIETLENCQHPKGAGLAAPQVGILKRVCVVKRFTSNPDDPEKEVEENFILINPEIVDHSDETDLDWEGCLSVPDTYGRVERFKSIRVKSLDLKGNYFIFKAENFFARVI
ncbi:peptide deformylase, partial [candidate division WWE3 bacterium]|nr:peptide deformylase [candidate division WWE3 bacterium]